jgi:hypothetical protein
VNGQSLAKEFGDQDIVDIWTKGLEKDPKVVTGFSQYKLPSGVVRVIYTITQRICLGKNTVLLLNPSSVTQLSLIFFLS